MDWKQKWPDKQLKTQDFGYHEILIGGRLTEDLLFAVDATPHYYES